MQSMQEVNENTYGKLAEDIKRDLINTFNSKGINVTTVKIDMKSDNVSIEVYIKGEME